MKNAVRILLTTGTLIALSIGSAGANVFVFGMVVDTAKNPVVNASIIVRTGGSGGGEIIDTLYSGNNGRFAKTVVYASTLQRIRYSASKEGYATTSGMRDVVRDTADLDTITLRNIVAGSVYVFGMVIDTAKRPVDAARIILSTGGTGSGTILDTLFSNTAGTFAKRISVLDNIRRINYSVSKTGYVTANGNGDVIRDTCNLDTITLRPAATIAVDNMPLNIAKTPNKIALYTMHGRLIYCGYDFDYQKKLRGRIARAQMLIVHYMLDNTVLYRKKIAPTK